MNPLKKDSSQATPEHQHDPTRIRQLSTYPRGKNLLTPSPAPILGLLEIREKAEFSRRNQNIER